jgi:hypothetical protein
MSINHRTYTRVPIKLDVELLFKGQNMGHASVRNINQFGAFIELPKSKMLTNDFIKMYFSNKGLEQRGVEQKGMVVHVSKEGVGIIFASDSEEFRTMLQQEMTDAGITAMGIRAGNINH